MAKLGLFRMTVLSVAAVGWMASVQAAPVLRDFSIGLVDNITATFPVFTPAPGDFLDVIHFDVSAPSVAFGGAANLPFDDPLIAGIESNFVIAALALYDPAFNQISIGTGTSDLQTVFGTLSTPGTYSLAILGSANGTVNGAYQGFVQTVALSAVPEPATYGLVALGLLVGGGATFRRRRC